MADLNLNPYTFSGISLGRKRIVILAGGNSSEREISILSGLNVADALRLAGNDVDILDPADMPLDAT
ncbi:MAG: hypothetical protein KDA36_08585, partial [Planctomycetaceae bacterium]|nr:hypothetical protein [Planctomycetaceae bacterium]